MSIHGVSDPAVAEAIRAYVKLLRATKAVVGRVERLVGSAGLTLTQLGVLEVILHQGPLTHRELGRKVLTSPGNITDVVDKLERRHLVRRVRAADDRRHVRVELTETGQLLIEDLFPRHAEDIADAMAGLSAEELRHLDALLRKLGMAAAQGANGDLVGADG